ncbi:DUF4330 domain-containing protein [Papillibacter cinnamivorans]|uniref:DUF4330 domain-containing protein n=1 Tax=Papillibacter cinnamivorans DSM 12816 TaxID=1122930 RepID=A0A1W1Z271_9FIRM|nr:DUF4330 domain-containing protein [Papillibacter cinnamivorans]SMC42529.1 protein of unknown function [Papillibacter cinnamivorans DSM 12816]
MKIVDEKGKLFGAVNLVDLVVLILVIGGIALAVWKFTGVSDTFFAKKVQITYTVKAEGLDPELYEQTLKHVPSTLMAAGEKLPGQITGVTKQPHMVCVLGEDGQPIWVEDPYHIDLTFTVEATVTETTNVLMTQVGTQEVRIGKKHIVKSEYIEVEGIITGLERSEES